MADPTGMLIGFVILAVGVLSIRYAYEITTIEERIDAIGTRRDRSDIEPTKWRVEMTVRVAQGMIIVGGAIVLLAWLF
jgi:hypothetical protein